MASPQGYDRQLEVRGERVELTWIVQPGSVGDRVYAAVGMAADPGITVTAARMRRAMTDGSSSTTGWTPRLGRWGPRLGVHIRRDRSWSNSRALSTSAG